jgi:hypothetical protein
MTFCGSVVRHENRLQSSWAAALHCDQFSSPKVQNFGFCSVCSKILQSQQHRGSISAALQVNSNVLVKSAVSSARLCAAFVFKSWWDPCFTVSAMAGWDFRRAEPCAGISLHVDNDAELRYERGFATTQTGGLVRQKHVATKAEGKVAHGTRLVVRGDKSERDASDEKLLVPPTVTHARSTFL